MLKSALRPLQIKDLGLGLHTDVNAFQVPLGGCVACNNLVYHDGFLKPRPGIAEAYSTLAAGRIHHINRYIDQDRNVSLMRLDMIGDDISLYQNFNLLGWTLVDNTSMVNMGSLQYPPCSASWKGDFWTTTGEGKVFRYDGNADVFASVESLQAEASLKIPYGARILCAGNARLFIADCYDTPDDSGDRVGYRVAWCDSLDGTTWNIEEGKSSGYVDLADEDSDPVTGLYYTGSTIMAFKPTAYHIGVPAAAPKVFDFRQRSATIGCVNHKTIKPYLGGWIYWLGNDNVYRGGVDRDPEAVGDRIVPRLREVCAMSDVHKVRALIDRVNHFYHLYFPASSGSGAGNVFRIFSLNLKNGGWWEGSFAAEGFDISDALEFRAQPWGIQCLLATSTGKLYEVSFTYTSDAGQAVSSFWKSGIISMGELSQGNVEQVSPQIARAYAESGTVRLGVYVGDNLDRMELSDFGTQSSDGSSDVMTCERPHAGENFQLLVSHDNIPAASHIAKLSLSGIPMGGETRR